MLTPFANRLSGETAIYQKIEEDEEIVADALNDLNDKISGLTDDVISIAETIDSEVERLDSRIDAEAEERKQNDIDFTGDYTMEVVGGTVLNKVNGDSVKIAFDGDFSKYNPNKVENGWTLFSE